jgi:HD-GYP domain-containing protein (c-di-GMP phosphodiesterase class II)
MICVAHLHNMLTQIPYKKQKNHQEAYQDITKNGQKCNDKKNKINRIKLSIEGNINRSS